MDSRVYVCRNRRDSRKTRIHASITDTGFGGIRSVKKGMYVAFLSSSFVHELNPGIGCHMTGDERIMPWRERIASLVEIVEERTCLRHLIANSSEAECDVALACRGLRGWLNLCR